MESKLLLTYRPLYVSDYCSSHLDIRPYYWFEESVELYNKANDLIEKMNSTRSFVDGKILRELVQADVDLIELWKAFENDAMVGIDQINDGSISSTKLPNIFGYPDTVYHYNGIILVRVCRGDVLFSFKSIGIIKEC